MKTAYLKKHLIKFLFAAAFTPGAGITAIASQVHGNVDNIQDNVISGWAWNAETPAEAPQVSVAIFNSAGTIVDEMSAAIDICREDVAASGYGSGLCGFSIPMDWSKLPDDSYTVSVMADGQPVGGQSQYQKGQPRLRSLGVFKTTGYCPCRSCSKNWGRNTSTGAIAKANHTIAVDPRVIPYGSRVMINGIIYTAEDCGGSVRGNHIDIFFDTHGESRNQGVQYAEVFLVES